MPSLTNGEWRDVAERIGSQLADRLATVHDPSEYTSISLFPSTELDLDALISLRLEHQTEQASSGVRRSTKQVEKAASDPTRKAKRLLLERYKDILRDRDEIGISTGLDRAQRWRHAAPGGRDGIVDGARSTALAAGTALNAAEAAKKRADTVRLLSVHHVHVLEILPSHVDLMRLIFPGPTEARKHHQEVQTATLHGHSGDLSRASASRCVWS